MSIHILYLSIYLSIYLISIYSSICLLIHRQQQQQQLCHSPKQSLASSVRCLQDSIYVAFSFTRSCAKQRDGMFYHSIFPSSPGFSYPSLDVKCFLQSFVLYRIFLHSDYMPCPQSHSYIYFVLLQLWYKKFQCSCLTQRFYIPCIAVRIHLSLP
jgi:hypothetical protein